MAERYILRVTAGPDYDPSTHKEVQVNQAEPMTIKGSHADVQLNVRIQNYRGLPRSSPSTSPYFDTPQHSTNKDQYSIGFSFTPRTDIPGDDLVFGNDFDHPIRDRLPPGFGTAMKIVKWGIDPGLDGDVYAEKPYLYGPVGSSINQLRVGDKGEGEKSGGVNAEYGIEVTEGGDGDGEAWRKEAGVPDGEAARKKWFLNESHRKGFTWEGGRKFTADFFNAYLDFNEFALKLPGFQIGLFKFWDGQNLRPEHIRRSHTLRYVLKNRATGDVLFVVLFTLYLQEDIDEQGNIKEGVVGGKKIRHGGVVPENGEDQEAAAKAGGEVGEEAKVETSADDVD